MSYSIAFAWWHHLKLMIITCLELEILLSSLKHAYLIIHFHFCFLSTRKGMDGRSHVRWNQWALIIYLWLNRARVCVCVVGGLNQCTERDIFVHSVGVNKSVKAFFFLSAGRVCLSHSSWPSIRWERASQRAAWGESKRSVWGLRGEEVERVLFSSRCTAIRNDFNAVMPHMRHEGGRICISAQIWFISMQFRVRVHVWNDGPRLQSGSGTLQRLLQSYQHHPDPSVLTSTALSKTHTHTHTRALASHSSDGERVERERESARGNQGDGW